MHIVGSVVLCLVVGVEERVVLDLEPLARALHVVVTEVVDDVGVRVVVAGLTQVNDHVVPLTVAVVGTRERDVGTAGRAGAHTGEQLTDAADFRAVLDDHERSNGGSGRNLSGTGVGVVTVSGVTDASLLVVVGSGLGAHCIGTDVQTFAVQDVHGLNLSRIDGDRGCFHVGQLGVIHVLTLDGLLCVVDEGDLRKHHGVRCDRAASQCHDTGIVDVGDVQANQSLDAVPALTLATTGQVGLTLGAGGAECGDKVGGHIRVILVLRGAERMCHIGDEADLECIATRVGADDDFNRVVLREGQGVELDIAVCTPQIVHLLAGNIVAGCAPDGAFVVEGIVGVVVDGAGVGAHIQLPGIHDGVVVQLAGGQTVGHVLSAHQNELLLALGQDQGIQRVVVAVSTDVVIHLELAALDDLEIAPCAQAVLGTAGITDEQVHVVPAILQSRHIDVDLVTGNVGMTAYSITQSALGRLNPCGVPDDGTGVQRVAVLGDGGVSVIGERPTAEGNRIVLVLGVTDDAAQIIRNVSVRGTVLHHSIIDEEAVRRSTCVGHAGILLGGSGVVGGIDRNESVGHGDLLLVDVLLAVDLDSAIQRILVGQRDEVTDADDATVIQHGGNDVTGVNTLLVQDTSALEGIGVAGGVGVLALTGVSQVQQLLGGVVLTADAQHCGILIVQLALDRHGLALAGGECLGSLAVREERDVGDVDLTVGGIVVCQRVHTEDGQLGVHIAPDVGRIGNGGVPVAVALQVRIGEGAFLAGVDTVGALDEELHLAGVVGAVLDDHVAQRLGREIKQILLAHDPDIGVAAGRLEGNVTAVGHGVILQRGSVLEAEVGCHVSGVLAEVEHVLGGSVNIGQSLRGLHADAECRTLVAVIKEGNALGLDLGALPVGDTGIRCVTGGDEQQVARQVEGIGNLNVHGAVVRVILHNDAEERRASHGGGIAALPLIDSVGNLLAGSRVGSHRKGLDRLQTAVCTDVIAESETLSGAVRCKRGTLTASQLKAGSVLKSGGGNNGKFLCCQHLVAVVGIQHELVGAGGDVIQRIAPGVLCCFLDVDGGMLGSIVPVHGLDAAIDRLVCGIQTDPVLAFTDSRDDDVLSRLEGILLQRNALLAGILCRHDEHGYEARDHDQCQQKSQQTDCLFHGSVSFLDFGATSPFGIVPCAISFYTKSGFLSTGIFAIFHNRIKFRRFYHIYRTLFEQYANFPGDGGAVFGGEGEG